MSVVPARIAFALLAVFSILASALFRPAAAAAAVDIDFVRVVDPANVCDMQFVCAGEVDRVYEISTFEVTNLQYTEFLNSVAASDPNGLYSTSMDISRSGADGSYTYASLNDQLPVIYVSLFDSLRFANWLHNGKPSGDQDETTTEDGAYTLLGSNPGGVVRNPSALFFLPNDDEWYKAAYYDPALNSGNGGYYAYPTRSNTPTMCTFPPVATPNFANCNHSQAVLVGLFTGSASPWGSFDQGGNLWERVEGDQVTSGVIRGGSWEDGGAQFLESSAFSFIPSTTQIGSVGFRVARVPDPFMTVGDPGNAPDDTSFGAVDHVYEIGTYEVTYGEWAEFLNAIAATDPTGLYDAAMDILRSGSDGSFSYAATDATAPVTRVSFFDAIRYANWLHNGKPSGTQNATTTEDGAYTLLGQNPLDVTRNPEARVFLPSENEWYKAAYYDPDLNGGLGGYYDYPAGSDVPLVCANPTPTPNSGSCAAAALEIVGSYTGSPSPSGSFDQGGNANEWTDQLLGDLRRVLRGGSSGLGSVATSSGSREGTAATLGTSSSIGFRVARIPNPWRTIGDPGNACDSRFNGCFGAVADVYDIGTFEVTQAEYTEFLNAVAASDPNALYSANMDIVRSGSNGSFTYTTAFPTEAVSNVSSFAALRYANWLHNGKPSGAQNAATTEAGSYTLLGQNPTDVTRNAGGHFFLPTEDEWYKAAYYDRLLDVGTGGYYDYPTASDVQVTCAPPSAAANQANCAGSGLFETIVGSYTGSPSPWGTFDQGGNVQEWNEAIDDPGERIIRGGSRGSTPGDLSADFRFGIDAASQCCGFRLVRVPEPSGTTLALAAVSTLAALARRRMIQRSKPRRSSAATPC